MSVIDGVNKAFKLPKIMRSSLQTISQRKNHSDIEQTNVCGVTNASFILIFVMNTVV